MAYYIGYCGLGYAAAEEKGCADRRRAQAYIQIHNENYAKMQWVHAEFCNYR